MTLRNILSTLVLLALSQQLLSQPANAHGGEDHSHDPAPLAQARGLAAVVASFRQLWQYTPVGIFQCVLGDVCDLLQQCFWLR